MQKAPQREYIYFLDIHFLYALVNHLPSEPLVRHRLAMPTSIRSARHIRLAELLAEYRQKAGLHQSDVAKKLGRHQPFIANIESGQRRVDVVEYLQLSEALGFDPSEVLKLIAETPE